MILSDKVYDILKYITRFLLPALGTLYLTLSKIWGLPWGEEIPATIMAAIAFFSTLLGISNMNYKVQNQEEE